MDNAPDDIAEIYEIESLEQLRAITDELRVRILDHLSHQPLTVTQLGERLGVAPAKAHYHVRELERVGLVRLVATRENRGILEKYYRAAAHTLRVPDGLFQGLPPDEVIATGRQFVDYLARGYLAAMERKLHDGDETSGPQLVSSAIWATDEEVRELAERVSEMLRPYDNPRGMPGERERMVAQLSYPLPPAGATQVDDGERAELKADDDQRAKAGHRRRRAFVAGTYSYSRADLEYHLATGQQLDIYVLGEIAFADDVTPELAERVISRFRLKGKLTAPPGVREVLERKSKEE